MGLLRVILSIAVVISHSESFFGLKFTEGLVSVQIFFIISGFYMTMILDNKYFGKGSYQLFLSNRFLRLYPIYWVVMIITIVSSIISFVLFNYWARLSSYVSYFDVITFKTLLFQIITNLIIFGQDVVMFLGMNPENGTMFFTSNFGETTLPFHAD